MNDKKISFLLGFLLIVSLLVVPGVSAAVGESKKKKYDWQEGLDDIERRNA